MTGIDRIPLAHSVRYVAHGLPEVPNHYGPGVLAPSEITLTYRAAPDSQLGRVHAYVAGRLWVDGKEVPLLPGGLYGQHYLDGLDNWPEWLAEEARLHDPERAAVSAAVAPPTQAADEVDADTVANRAAQVITTMGAEIRELKHSRDRYRTAWLSARHRAELRRMADETATETPQPSLRDQHRAAWHALTPDQQAARLAELDAIDEPAAGARQDGAET